MSDKKTNIEFGEEVAGKTIVGGRAQRRAGRPQEIPIGIEKVLYLAATDAEFNRALFSNRAEALAREELKLSDAERAILASVPEDQLRAMVGRIDTQAHGRRRFLRKVAAAAIGLAATTAVVDVGCGQADTGSAPDYVTRGISHDIPDTDTGDDAGDDQADGGAADDPPVSRGIGPDVPDEDKD